jgi:hypothetical protein
MLSDIDSLSASIYKLKALADLLGAPAEERMLQEMTLRWTAVLINDELERMEEYLEHIDMERRAVGA